MLVFFTSELFHQLQLLIESFFLSLNFVFAVRVNDVGFLKIVLSFRKLLSQLFDLILQIVLLILAAGSNLIQSEAVFVLKIL